MFTCVTSYIVKHLSLWKVLILQKKELQDFKHVVNVIPRKIIPIYFILTLIREYLFKIIEALNSFFLGGGPVGLV